MSENLFNILICDDDESFAKSQADFIKRKMQVRHGFVQDSFSVGVIFHRDKIFETLQKNNYDIIFCDLGWGDLTLEGVQVLNQVKLDNPSIVTVLYTAQSESESITQTLNWKLSFIDHIIHIHGDEYSEKLLHTLLKGFSKKRKKILHALNDTDYLDDLELFISNTKNSKSSDNIRNKIISDKIKLLDLFPEVNYLMNYQNKVSQEKIDEMLNQLEEFVDGIDDEFCNSKIEVKGLRLLPKDMRTEFVADLEEDLINAAEMIRKHMSRNLEQMLALDISVSQNDLGIKLKVDPLHKKYETFNQLKQNEKNYPRIADHDLLALDKEKFISYIKTQYGGFPQMADKRGLDLNNIYRVNRKFKNLPFIVFKLDTIREILGIYKQSEFDKTLKKIMLSSKKIQEYVEDFV